MRVSSTTIQQWLRLCHSSTSLNSATLITRANKTLAPPAAATLSIPATRNHSSNSKRHFHSSQCRQVQRRARPAPSTRERQRSPGIGFVNKSGIWLDPISYHEDDAHDWVERRMRAAAKSHSRAIADGYLPEDLSSDKFTKVFATLANRALYNRPTASFIQSIHPDVDNIFRIGYVCSADDAYFREWIISACALAGARLPVALIVARQLRGDRLPARDEWFRKIETFSNQNYPPAMLLQAKIHIRRNELDEAQTLLENRILPYVTPTNRHPTFFTDMVLGGMIESPWRLYALLFAKKDQLHKTEDSQAKADKQVKADNQVKADKALHVAAMEYSDVDALMEYAAAMMVAGDLDLYEECMLKAASAGKGEACLFIANFYYLTSYGSYPTRGERKKLKQGKAETIEGTSKPAKPAKSTPTTWLPNPYKWIKSFFQQSLGRKDYADLAEDWYFLAYEHGQPKAAMMMALLSRETGGYVDGMMFLRQALEDDPDMQTDPKSRQRLQTWITNWYEKGFEPRLGRKELPVK